MIKEEIVQVRLNPANKRHYAQFGYTGENGEFIDVLTTHLTKSSETIITRVCDECGGESLTRRKGYSDVCHKCKVIANNNKRKQPEAKCEDCGKTLQNLNSKRCKPCHSKYMVGENNPNYGNGDKIRGERNVNWQGGKPCCVDCGERLSNGNYKDVVRMRCDPCFRKQNVGENHPLYKRENHFCPVCDEPKAKHSVKCMGCHLAEIHNPEYTGRRTTEQSTFARLVKERDGYTCVLCGTQDEPMYAHHLEGWQENEDLRVDVTNGVCLCGDCHMTFHKQYGFGSNTTEQYLEFKEKCYGSN